MTDTSSKQKDADDVFSTGASALDSGVLTNDQAIDLQERMSDLNRRWNVLNIDVIQREKRLDYYLLTLAEFILEKSYPSRRIIRQTDNSSKYKSEDEFYSITCLIFYTGTTAGNRKHCENIETSPSHVETIRLDINLETDNPSKTNYPSDSTSSRHANRRISLRRILLHNSSYTRDG